MTQHSPETVHMALSVQTNAESGVGGGASGGGGGGGASGGASLGGPGVSGLGASWPEDPSGLGPGSAPSGAPLPPVAHAARQARSRNRVAAHIVTPGRIIPAAPGRLNRFYVTGMRTSMRCGLHKERSDRRG